MKKYTFILLCFCLFTLVISAQNRSINFDHSTFKELKEKALKEHKLIFIDAYTTWCGPCKILAKNIFTNDTVADYYNANFINTKIDMEKGEGIELAQQYNVICYPTLLFIDGNGILVHRQAGTAPVNIFMNMGITAQDPEKNYAYYIKNYDSKKDEPGFLNKYIDIVAATCMDPKYAVIHYFSLQKESDLPNEANWNMIYSFTHDIDSREFTYLLNNRAKFEILYTPEKVNEKITDVAQTSLNDASLATPLNEKAYIKLRQKISQMNLPIGNQIIFEADLNHAKHIKDWNEYAKLAVANVDIYYSKNAYGLNAIAWDFYENVNNKKFLQKAEEWCKQAIAMGPSYAILDTYAAVLYKTGKKQEALAAGNSAIEQAKKEGTSVEDYAETTMLLEKIKAMK